MDKGMRVQTKLMEILSKATVPLYLFEKVQDWAYDAATKDGSDFGNAGTSLKGRRTYLKFLFTRYGLEDIQPKAVGVTLPASKVAVEMAIFDIRPGIYSLLTSPLLMQDKNLNFPNNLAAPGKINNMRAFLNKCTILWQYLDSLDMRFFFVWDNAYLLSNNMVIPFSGANKNDP
jgi:hypothetical protein